MIARQCEKFQQYVFCSEKPYSKNEAAIKDEELREFARKIIKLEDEFNINHKYPSRQELKKHLKKMLELTCSELSETSRLVKEIKSELYYQETENQQASNYYDALIRIRAVFDLNQIKD